MKVISDIRLYRSSETDNCLEVLNKQLNLYAHRVAMKLREYSFSLGEYDHLYLNFTTLKPEGTIELNHSVDPYYPFFRYCDLGINQNEYDNLENIDCISFLCEKSKLFYALCLIQMISLIPL